MKFKTRIIITFLTIILLPLVLTCTAFLCIGGYLAKSHEELGLRNRDYNILIDPTQASRHISDEIFLEIEKQLENNPNSLDDIEILKQINERIKDRASYIIVRKGEQIYYTGNEIASGKIFDNLPDFEEERVKTKLAQSIYFDDMKKMVRQMDFYFPDGQEGSFFIITRANTILTKTLFIDMAIAILIMSFIDFNESFVVSPSPS